MAEPLARPAARRLRAWRAGRGAGPCARSGRWPGAAAGIVVLALGMLAAGAAEAARLVDVRVGRHQDFVRVVFETDAPARFSVEPGERPGERRVRIEAGGDPGALQVPAGAGAEVTLEPLPDGATLARIRAAGPVRIESQVLDRPPRIVFDLRPGEPELTASEVEAAPAPEPEPAPEAEGSEAVGPAEPEDALEAPPGEEAEPAGVAAVQPGETSGSPPSPGPLLAPELREPTLFPELAPPVAEEEPPAAEPPAVSAPPPGAIERRLDDRSLLVGAAGGLALALGLSLVARGGRRRPAEHLAGDETQPAEPPPLVTLPAPSPGEEPGEQPGEEAGEEAPKKAPAAPGTAPVFGAERAGDLGLDLLAMLQRLDDRLVRLEETLRGLVARTEQLEVRGGIQSEELATQRVALARLHLAIAPPGPRREARPGVVPPPARQS